MATCTRVMNMWGYYKVHVNHGWINDTLEVHRKSTKSCFKSMFVYFHPWLGGMKKLVCGF